MNSRLADSPAQTPAGTHGGRRHALAPVIAVTAASLVFAVLLIMVRLAWPPLESADHGTAAGANSLLAGHPAIVTVIKAITWLGRRSV